MKSIFINQIKLDFPSISLLLSSPCISFRGSSRAGRPVAASNHIESNSISRRCAKTVSERKSFHHDMIWISALVICCFWTDSLVGLAAVINAAKGTGTAKKKKNAAERRGEKFCFESIYFVSMAIDKSRSAEGNELNEHFDRKYVSRDLCEMHFRWLSAASAEQSV